MPGVCADGLKAAYRAQALRHHPDRNLSDRDGAKRAFKELNGTFAQLTRGFEQARRQSRKAAEEIYCSVYPYDVFGVRKLQMEGTLKHLVRAATMRFRRFDSDVVRLPCGPDHDQKRCHTRRGLYIMETPCPWLRVVYRMLCAT